MDIFEKAVREKLRFNIKGLCSVEELWDLPLRDLDAAYMKFNKELKEEDGESLLKEYKKTNDSLRLKVDVLKHIVSARLIEKQNKKDSLEKAEKKKKLLEILAEKQDDQLKSLSPEEIKEMIDKM